MFKILKERKHEPQILYLAKLTLTIKNTVSLVFKTSKSQKDCRDFNMSTGNELYIYNSLYIYCHVQKIKRGLKKVFLMAI